MKRVCFPILLYIFITQISAQEESPKRFDYPNKVSTTSHNAKIGTAPFIFIFSSGHRRKEIHLSVKMPICLADNITFCNSHNDINITVGKTYQTQNNLPWTMHIIHDFRYPIGNTNY